MFQPYNFQLIAWVRGGFWVVQQGTLRETTNIQFIIPLRLLEKETCTPWAPLKNWGKNVGIFWTGKLNRFITLEWLLDTIILSNFITCSYQEKKFVYISSHMIYFNITDDEIFECCNFPRARFILNNSTIYNWQKNLI